MQSIYNIWPVLQHFNCSYHPPPTPPSSGLVECTNGTIKTQIAKFPEALSPLANSSSYNAPQPKIHPFW